MQKESIRGSQGGSGGQNLVEYLLSQNKQLKDDVSDLRELVQMNKLEIDVLSKNNPGNKYIEVISNYRLASDNFQQKIQILESRLDSLHSEKLVLEQLNQEASEELKATEELHRGRIQSLQAVIEELQKKVASLEKYERHYDTLTGFVERNKEVWNPTEQALQFLGVEEGLREEVLLLKHQCKRGKENEEDLLKVNGILRHKVVTLQAKLAMPNKNLGQILDKSLKRLMMYFIETQKRILTGEESDSEGEEDLQLIAPELSTYFGEETVRKQKKYNVPYLDLLKVRGSIANGNQKIKEELLKRNHLSKDQRIERLQIQLEYTRRELTKHMVDLKEQTDRRKAIEAICTELEARNDLLTAAHEKASRKLAKFVSKAKESKEKQLKFIQLDQTLNDITTTLVRHDNNLADLQQKKPIDPYAKLNLNVSQTPEEYKIHLELLQRDLAKNTKLQHPEKLKQRPEEAKAEEGEESPPQQPKLIRSTSNPLLYFNERREDIMKVAEPIPSSQLKGRMEQTAIMGRRGQGQELLDDIDI